MGSCGIVENKVVTELFSEAGQIIDKVEVMVDELFLKGPVESFNPLGGRTPRALNLISSPSCSEPLS